MPEKSNSKTYNNINKHFKDFVFSGFIHFLYDILFELTPINQFLLVAFG